MADDDPGYVYVMLIGKDDDNLKVLVKVEENFMDYLCVDRGIDAPTHYILFVQAISSVSRVQQQLENENIVDERIDLQYYGTIMQRVQEMAMLNRLCVYP